MGHQLVFWQQAPDSSPDAHDVYRELMHDGHVDGLRSLPLAPILTSLATEFAGIDPVPSPDGSRPVFWQDGETVIEFWWSEVHVGAELRGPWSGEVANRVIDVLAEFGLPLYDPQTGERFDSWLAG